MADAIVRAQALRWVSDDFPGWMEVGLVDADGHEHRIVEKVPALTTRNITAASAFPAEFWVRADTGEVSDGRARVVFTDGVETTEGRSVIQVRLADVKWL